MSNWTVSASTPTGTASNAQAQLYASEVWREARVNSFWNPFMGEGPNNVIQIRRDFMKSKGDAINYNLVADLSQKGLAGSGLQSLLYFGSSAATRRLEGNEEAPTVYADSVVLDQLRHAVITGGKLSEQRLAFEMRPEMKNNLAYWYARIAFDEVIFKKLSGVTFTDSQSRTLGEAAVANTNNIYGGNKTASNQLTSGDTFEPTLFRKAKEAAMTGVGTVNASNVANATIWKIRPMIIGGKPYYGACLHPYQVYDLQGSQAWEQAHREIQGLREHNDNPIFSGALGLWNGVIIYSHDKVITGSDAGPGSDVPYADALFFGYQAGLWAEAQQAPDWVEKSFDYGDQYGVSTSMMFGFDKTQFNSLDFACIKIRTAASSHS